MHHPVIDATQPQQPPTAPLKGHSNTPILPLLCISTGAHSHLLLYHRTSKAFSKVSIAPCLHARLWQPVGHTQAFLQTTALSRFIVPFDWRPFFFDSIFPLAPFSPTSPFCHKRPRRRNIWFSTYFTALFASSNTSARRHTHTPVTTGAPPPPAIAPSPVPPRLRPTYLFAAPV